MNHPSHTGGNYVLIGKYLSGEASPSEAMEMEQWLSADEDNKQLFEQISRAWTDMMAEEPHQTPNPQELLQAIKKQAAPSPGRVKALRLKTTWLRIAVSILIVSCMALLILLPGKIGHPHAALIIRQTENHLLNDTLPDRSVVIMNGHSRLTYLAHFAAQQRDVQLNGEAWFSVTPNTAKPFIITTGNIRIKVVGTSFNVRNNTNSIEVTVKTGIVRMLGNNDSLTVKVGQKGVYNSVTRQFTLLPAFNINEIAYATRVFNFENASLKEIATQLEKAYGITIIFKNEKLAACTMSSSFDNKSIEYIFDVLAMTLNIQYQIVNKKVYISGNSCT